MSLFVLFENASGYALFEQTESDEIAQLLEEMQDAMADLSRQVPRIAAICPSAACRACTQ
jgi:hypothetical protein